MEGFDRMQVPQRASATHGSGPRSSRKCWKSPIACGLPRMSSPSLETIAEDSPSGKVAAQPSDSHTPAVRKQRTRRSDDPLSTDEYSEAVNLKKKLRNGILLPERSHIPMIDNRNFSKGLTTNPIKQSCSSGAEPQGNSPLMQTLEGGKWQDTSKDSECFGSVDKKNKRLASDRERSKKQIPRKCNGGTIHSAAPTANGEIKPVVLENIGSEPYEAFSNALASRRTGNANTADKRAFRVSVKPGSQDRPSLYEKTHLLGAADDRKPSTTFLPQTIQWVGVGPRQRRPRSRRTNNAFSVSASPNLQLLEGWDLPQHERMVSANTSRLRSPKDGASGTPHLKVKLKGLSLPAIPSEHVACPGNETKTAEMTAGGVEPGKRYMKKVQNNSISTARNRTTFRNEESSDGKKRRGRRRKISRFAERSDNRDPTPVGAVNKNESNTVSEYPPVGRSSDQMNSTHQENTMLNEGACDDWNELFKAPKPTSKPSCLTSFEDLWKDMEPVQMMDKNRSCPREQGELVDGHRAENQTQVHKEEERVLINQSATAKPVTPGCRARQEEDINTNKLCRELNTGVIKFGPLFERVLSALIFEDGRTLVGDDEETLSFLHGGDDYECSKHEDTLIQSPSELIPYGDEVNSHDDGIGKNIQNGISMDELPKVAPCSTQNVQCLAKEGNMAEELSTPQSICSDECYERMSIDFRLLLELNSLGIYPEALPHLTGEEDKAIIRRILEAREHVADQLGSESAHSEALNETVPKGTSATYKDLEGSATEEASIPSYIAPSVHKKATALRTSKPEVPKDAVPSSNLRAAVPVRRASGVTCSQRKQRALPITRVPMTQNPERGGTGGALPRHRRDMRAEVLVNMSKSSAKGESNMKTTSGKLTNQVFTASEAVTKYAKEETGSANPGNEEYAGSPNDMLDGSDLSHWLGPGDDDAIAEDELNGLQIPMDDLSDLGIFQ